MKKLITGVLLSACIATTAFAGGKHSDGHRGQGFLPIHKMVRVLDLSDEQKDQLKALKAEMRADRTEKGSQTSLKAQLAALDASDANYEQDLNELANLSAERAKERVLKMADMRVKVQQILTPEQLEKFNAMAEKRAKRHNKKRQDNA
ncbi:Spy/CpxP family protein refolding chaperone [Paraglaciecola chathamensis]|uniref:Spy/CpxP family protein refolding chaperone n=1 Tax=Paraglaciecola chathamensis TaxID=368405 RepID=A0ABS0WHB4_9ALTE|nr:Spy/CpxP family protein refolding chaperone [Paraglaciecola chathamensis]MBJ2137866.1 Spy/CpxP family protein refolding chaperone [Paraglaciecola chathamensis]